ncbi:SDR family NAD(P)-dependent oxidoreductase [Cellulomonas sp. NPDC057328]|uniref:SDR family NAD(P)-dependent oxidoreductase n=1 Tax=Cellulomonas sp. NPDC057328 TaxID=3346101 RepID=UPI0036285803
MQHTIVMTGASRGIGYAAAVEALRRSPDLHLVVTTRGPGDELVARLARDSGNPQVGWVGAELASLACVRAAAEEVGRRLDRGTLPPLTGFVGNAGLQVTGADRATVDGLETTFAVNVLAHHLLLRLLAERMTTPARVVLTTSDTHFGDLRHNLGLVPAPRWRAPLELARPSSAADAGTATAGRRAYATSKLAVIHLVHELARRLPEVEVVAWNPGFVPGTELTRDGGTLTRLVARHLLPLLARTPLAVDVVTAGGHLASLIDGRPVVATGAYVSGDAEERSSAESYDVARERALWEAADHLCGLA